MVLLWFLQCVFSVGFTMLLILLWLFCVFFFSYYGFTIGLLWCCFDMGFYGLTRVFWYGCSMCFLPAIVLLWFCIVFSIVVLWFYCDFATVFNYLLLCITDGKKTWWLEYIVSNSKSIRFPFITQLKYYSKWWEPNKKKRKKHQLWSYLINRGCEPSFYPILLLIFNFHN